MKNFFLAALILLVSACAVKSPMQGEQSELAEAWESMQMASAAAKGPYRLQFSMRFGEEGNTRRVTGVLWGNGDNALRLDIMAGVGATIARIAENGDDFLVYAPRENRAYFHDGPAHPLLKIGVPVPFDLAMLANILTGKFSLVFGKEYEDAAFLANGNPAYELDAPLGGRLELNGAGEPILWKQDQGGWKLELAYEDSSPYLPVSAKLINTNGKRAIILVKEREQAARPFDSRQLELAIPASAPRLPLSQFKPS